MLAARRDRGLAALEPRGPRRRMRFERPGAFVVAASVSVGALAASAAWVLGFDPLVCRGSLGASGAAALLLSLGCGVLLGTLTIGLTPQVVQRWGWASSLHSALRPAVRDAGDATILLLAASTAAGEELLFRGLLVPLVGVVASALLFGALHQVRGPARWPWMLWAAAMGLFFGAVYRATGNLAGPLVAHAVINHHNLRFLRDHNPQPPARALGGLLRRG